MTDEEPATEETDTETEADAEAETETEADAEAEATLDVEAAQEREETVEQLREQVAEQQARIEELEDIMLDMSARAAHDGGTGVCPDCHGPVIKTNPFLRSPKVKCTSCGRVFHEY
ncbi:hypothetical protein [Halosegnis sp.]|uniref:hypothetical protein n=1 Tax=Halosegnis sp. TaxID=2864959 RepID=UPI0035D3ECC7